MEYNQTMWTYGAIKHTPVHPYLSYVYFSVGSAIDSSCKYDVPDDFRSIILIHQVNIV